MAELKDLLTTTKTLSLLYIDENLEFLGTITTLLRKVFKKIDDASNITLGLDYLKVNSYDLVVVDVNSSIMNPEHIISNIKKYSPYQEIILTATPKTKDALIAIYELQATAFLRKPFKTTIFLETILNTSLKLMHHRKYLHSQIEKLENEITSQKKRIGRFMMNEKNLQKEIESYKNSAYINKNIYELTKLPSRFALQHALDGKEQSLIYINIDHFDFVNSTYGMGKANKLLKETARMLKIFLPTNASIYHITADEFVILLDEPAKNQAPQLASQIQSFFKETAVEFDNYSHMVVFSIGIDSGEGIKLFINAKAASKEARYYGGNQVVVYDAYSDYMKVQRNSLHWIGILKQAFDEDKIFTYYQPIIANETSKTKHYEVLCRLMDDKGDLVDANQFIHSAKQVGLITQISKTVIDKSFKLFTNNDYNFSINISMYDLHENYLLDFLNYKCERYNIASSRVHLEIVEDIIVNKTDIIDKQIIDLKNAGYHVIVDDFGTDKSAFNRMFELQAEFIKIDGSFIKELSKKESNQLIVKSIVDFAKKSGIKTIAEHVESQEVLDIVKTLDIDYSQGFFMGKPSLNLE